MGNACSGERENVKLADSTTKDIAEDRIFTHGTTEAKSEIKKDAIFVEIDIDDSLEIEEQALKNSSKGTIENGFNTLKAGKIEAISDTKQIIVSSECGFVHAVYLAFNHHIPLCFGPDDLWNLIIQGVSKHIELNAEKLRHKFVDFDGKKTLMIQRDNFVKGSPKNNWAGCFEEWSAQITKNIGQENTNNLIPNFSTTGLLEKAVHELSLMDCMKSYFEYGMRTCCGISKVKLLGSLEDWKELRKMLTNLRQYDLDWWMDAIEPVVDMIIKTYNGELKKEESKRFWYSIYKKYSTHGSGASTYVTGWITNFFPYTSNDSKRHRFTTLEYLMKEDKEENRGWGTLPGSIEHNVVPNGVLSCPFNWIYYGQKIPMNIYGGFAGCEYKDGYIQPVLAWAVGPDADGEMRLKLEEFTKLKGPMLKWNSKAVAEWLKESDSVLKEYVKDFKKAGITGKDLAGDMWELRERFEGESWSWDQWRSFRNELDLLR